MARLDGDLWRYNVARITFVDVTEDYRTLLDPMPSDFYPVVKDVYVPKYKLLERLMSSHFVGGYAYDWHEAPLPEEEPEGEHWFVGVVNEAAL